MGRKLMRVPLDFAWPMNMTWKGYVNPYRSQECRACESSGYNPETKKIADDFYGRDYRGGWNDKITQDETDALVAQGRLRAWVNGKWKSVPRTAAEVNAANGPGRSMIGDMCHDGINRWILVRTRAERLGVYGDCSVCAGEGHVWATEEIKRQHEEWKNFDPPSGDGFQLWETTSEGSPVSPVFVSLDELCSWAAVNATTFGSQKASASEWRRMLDADFVAHVEDGMVFI